MPRLNIIKLIKTITDLSRINNTEDVVVVEDYRDGTVQVTFSSGLQKRVVNAAREVFQVGQVAQVLIPDGHRDKAFIISRSPALVPGTKTVQVLP